MPIRIGIVGAGNRGRTHADAYQAIDDVELAAIADIDDDAASAVSRIYDVPAQYGDYRDMLEDADLDAVSVCLHNALHRSVSVDAAEAGCHVFCEKPMAPTYADAKAMADAAESNGVHLGVQNVRLFQPETRAARRLIEDGELGRPFYGRGVYSRRRGRPYINGYGTPAFVSKDTAGGGPVIDIGTYVIGQLLYLMGRPEIERVSGVTFEHTDETFAPDLVGDTDVYERRLRESGHDVEDGGFGFVRLADGGLLSIQAAWHLFLPGPPSAVAGTRGGVTLDPFQYYTTTSDYEATVSLDLEDFEHRQERLAHAPGYGRDGGPDQFAHWIDTIRGRLEDPIPTGAIALDSTAIMEGIYLSEAAGRELSMEAIAERSQPHE